MQKRSWSSAEIKLFKLDYNSVIEELREYARKALEKGAYAVILIGSLARGDYTAFSDADLVIIVGQTSWKPVERIKDYLDPSLSIDIEPRVYTIDELLRMAKEKRRIVREILEHGILLAGNDDILKMIKERYEKQTI